MRQYRKEIRKPTTGPAHITWEVTAGYTRKLDAQIQDVSSSGMGLLVSLSVDVGAHIKIVSNNKTQLAVVKRCVPTGRQYILGVIFEK